MNPATQHPSPAVCNHGHWLSHCAMCLKRENECDYGSCAAAATSVVRSSIECRRTCDAHAPIITVAAR